MPRGGGRRMECRDPEHGSCSVGEDEIKKMWPDDCPGRSIRVKVDDPGVRRQ